MKKLKYILIAASLMTTFQSCEKFLNVTRIDALSGNNFWKTRDQVEGYMAGIYTRLKAKVGNSMLIPALDIRGNFVKVVNNLDNNGNNPINNLISNNLKQITTSSTTYDNRLKDIMNWKGWYDVVAASNILIYEIDKVPANELSQSEKKKYIAEATFTRNLSYMYICKLFGDAIYYTEAYHTLSLPRRPQLEVLKLAIADMESVKDDFPISHSETSKIGFRPTKGAAIALLMHLNMWAAAWEENDKNKYYESVTNLGEELSSYSEYQLLPISVENTKKIFKGKTSENLFGILQEFNYGESFVDFANPSFFFSHYPYRGQSTKTNSHLAYNKKYIEELFPASISDQRKSAWFENIASDNGTFQLKKFINTYSAGSGANLTIRNDDSAIIFRLSDPLLLTAEAAAELGNDAMAQEYVNKVRIAAGAPTFTSTGNSLKNDIYFERCRELIGEGHFFFDLVRTKRAIDSDYSGAVISVGAFNAGAWTWPLIISDIERAANPNLIGNTFWN